MSCTAMAAMRKPNTFSVTNMRLSSSLALTWFAQRKTAISISKTNSRMAIATANTLERRHLSGDRHQADDAHRVQQVRHRQREPRARVPGEVASALVQASELHAAALDLRQVIHHLAVFVRARDWGYDTLCSNRHRRGPASPTNQLAQLNDEGK